MMNAISNVSNSSCVIMDPSAGPLLISIYIIAFILGLLFILVTIGPIIQQICRKNVLGIYLLSLSVSDLLYILTMPLWIYYLSNNHKWTLGQGLCSLAGFIYYSNLYISIYILCCISIDRCLAITFPLRVKASVASAMPGSSVGWSTFLSWPCTVWCCTWTSCQIRWTTATRGATKPSP